MFSLNLSEFSCVRPRKVKIVVKLNLSNPEGVIVLIHGQVAFMLFIVITVKPTRIRIFLILIVFSKVMQVEIIQFLFIRIVFSKISENGLPARKVNANASENVLD